MNFQRTCTAITSASSVFRNTRVHEDEIKIERINKHFLITSSAWRNSSQAATGGDGLIISRDAESNLCAVSSVSKRIIQATFAGNPATTIIVAYAPTNVQKNNVETIAFYQDLRRAIDNVQLPCDSRGYECKIELQTNNNIHARTNENGILFTELLCEKSLFISNDKFQKK